MDSVRLGSVGEPSGATRQPLPEVPAHPPHEVSGAVTIGGLPRRSLRIGRETIDRDKIASLEIALITCRRIGTVLGILMA
jgi:hypothetical protein